MYFNAGIIEYFYARTLRKYPWSAYKVFHESIMLRISEKKELRTRSLLVS